MEIEQASSLILAIETNDVLRLRMLIENCLFNANAQDHKGRTALHVACAKGALDIVRLLLAYGARADLKDVQRNTAVHVAAIRGNVEIVRSLLQSPYVISEEKDTYQKTFMAIDLVRGRLERLKNLSQNQPQNAQQLNFRHELESIVELLRDYLRSRGVDENQIQVLNQKPENFDLNQIEFLLNNLKL